VQQTDPLVLDLTGNGFATRGLATGRLGGEPAHPNVTTPTRLVTMAAARRRWQRLFGDRRRQ
jgi:hypothetical protein